MELKFAFFILTKTRRHCINSARFGNEVANKIRGLIFFAANWRMLWLAFWFRLRKESFSRAQEKFSAKGKRPRRPSGARRATPSGKGALSGKDILLASPGLPLILKPRDGRSSQGLYRVRTEKELSEALEVIRGAGREKDYLVQPLIEGRIVTADVVRFPDGRCTALPREEYVRTWNGAGLSVHVFRDKALEETCRAVAEELGVLGCVNFEFIHAEDGTYYFMECNPRFSGGTGFSIAAGDHVVRKHLAAFGAAPEEEDLEKDAQFRDVTECWIARKYVEVITEK